METTLRTQKIWSPYFYITHTLQSWMKRETKARSDIRSTYTIFNVRANYFVFFFFLDFLNILYLHFLGVFGDLRRPFAVPLIQFSVGSAFQARLKSICRQQRDCVDELWVNQIARSRLKTLCTFLIFFFSIVQKLFLYSTPIFILYTHTS